MRLSLTNLGLERFKVVNRSRADELDQSHEDNWEGIGRFDALVELGGQIRIKTVGKKAYSFFVVGFVILVVQLSLIRCQLDCRVNSEARVSTDDADHQVGVDRILEVSNGVVSILFNSFKDLTFPFLQVASK